MRFAVSILGTEVLRIDTTTPDATGPNVGDATAYPMGFGAGHSKYDEHEETP